MAAPAVTLSAPYTLFPLSLPLHQTRAKDREHASYRACYASPVESRKRKRQTDAVELATSVDGEGLNIYDVRATKTISSYALQPATRFACAPASSLLKGSKTGTFRRTYAAVSAPKKELICWEETTGAEDVAQEETPVKKFSVVTGGKADVVYMDDLSILASRAKRGDDAKGGLLAVFADRHVRFYSEDLSEEHYNYVLPAANEDAAVVYAATTSVTTARKALFKTRPGLDTLTAEEEILLLAVTQAGKTFTVQLLAIPTTANTRRPREVLTLELPAVDSADAEGHSTFSVHFATGTLYRLSHTRLVTYDLTADIPKVVSVLPILDVASTDASPSLLRISASTVLVSTTTGVSLYDTKFSSLQASAPVTASPASSTTLSRSSTPAHSFSTDTKTGNVFLTTYMPDLDLAVGYSQSGIIGLQFTRPRSTDRPKKAGLLIDSLCRGISGLEVAQKKHKSKSALSLRLETQRKQAEATVSALASARSSGDVNTFDRIFAAYVGYDLPAELPVETGNAALVKHQLSDSTLAIPESAHKPLRTDFVSSVLGLIFTPTTPRTAADEPGMELTFFPPSALRYLLESGNFSTLSLPVPDTLVPSLVAFDPSLRVLQWFLALLGELSTAEVIRAISLSLSPPNPPGDTSPLVYDIARTEVLRSALIRLAAFPNPTVIAALKTLPSNLLLQLISLLELELTAGEDTTSDPTRSIGLEDLRLITDLLTAAVDAVGLSGLLLAETSTVLDELSADVETALQTVEEAAGLKALLDEMFRHVNFSALASPPASPPPSTPALPTLTPNPKKQAQAAAKKARRMERLEAGRTGVPAPPTPARQLTAPPATPASKMMANQKLRRARASGKARDALLRRMNAKRVVGHKKMLKSGGVNVREMRKQDRPVALRGVVSNLLPLGLKGAVVDPVAGIEVKEKEGRGERKREYWREGLGAGVHSVETLVV